MLEFIDSKLRGDRRKPSVFCDTTFNLEFMNYPFKSNAITDLGLDTVLFICWPFPLLQQDVQALGTSGAGPPKFDDLEPPPYNAVVKLPTYEEAQQEKMTSDQQQHHQHPQHFGQHPLDGRLGPSNSHDPRNGFNFMASFNHPAGDSPYDTNTAELALGTDVYFFASFLSNFSYSYYSVSIDWHFNMAVWFIRMSFSVAFFRGLCQLWVASLIKGILPTYHLLTWQF